VLTLRRYCAAGVHIQYKEVNNPNHVSTAYYDLPVAAQWLWKMGHGTPIRDDCNHIPS